jgi:hypothetical protein
MIRSAAATAAPTSDVTKEPGWEGETLEAPEEGETLEVSADETETSGPVKVIEVVVVTTEVTVTALVVGPVEEAEVVTVDSAKTGPSVALEADVVVALT